MITTLALPWPPSVNHYYRHVGPRVLISKDGRRYRETVAAIARRAAYPAFCCPVDVDIGLYPPDKRRRDADNSLKCTLDSLTFAGVYEDDSLIRKLKVTMNPPMPPHGMAIIRIKEHDIPTDEGEAGGCGPPVP